MQRLRQLICCTCIFTTSRICRYHFTAHYHSIGLLKLLSCSLSIVFIHFLSTLSRLPPVKQRHEIKQMNSDRITSVQVSILSDKHDELKRSSQLFTIEKNDEPSRFRLSHSKFSVKQIQRSRKQGRLIKLKHKIRKELKTAFLQNYKRVELLTTKCYTRRTVAKSRDSQDHIFI